MFLRRLLPVLGSLCLLQAVALSQGTPEGKQPSFVSSSRRLLTAPELKDASLEWIDRSLRWTDYILENYPPGLTEHPLRRAALIRLDDILHIESAPRMDLVQAYYRRRMERVVAEIENTRVTEGLHVWKLYNMGFMVRSPRVTLAFDLVPGPPDKSIPGFAMEEALLKRLARQADILFLSHAHSDHSHPLVAGLFLELGKPVLAPEGLWASVPGISGKLNYPRRAADVRHNVSVGGVDPRQTLEVIAYPGHQGERPINNFYLVTTPDGYTIAHTGDQWGSEGPGGDFDWITQIGRDHQVDVLLPNCWGNALGRTIRGVHPQLVLPGHENEMAHTVDHREDYTQTYNRLAESNYPAIVMAWGEGFRYRKSIVHKEALTGVVHN